MQHSLARFIPLYLSFGALLCLTQAWGQGATITLSVNSPAVRFSPGNWAGDQGRGGGKSRVTWNNGAYCTWDWSTAATDPTATLEITDSTPGAAVSYFVDGKLTDNVPVPQTGGISILGLNGSGHHTLVVYTRSSPQSARWNRTNAFTVAGLTLDGQSVPGTAPPARPWVEIVGDSITEGIQADNGRDSNLPDYSFLIGQGLLRAGFDYDVSACGYSGWICPGDAGGDVPPYYFVSGSTDGHGGTYDDARSRWNKIDSVTGLLDSQGHLSGQGATGQEPAAILINYIVNEAIRGLSTSDDQASVSQCIAALRHSAPNAWIFILVPPGLYNAQIYPQGASYVAALKAGVADYQGDFPHDHKIVTIDLGPNVSNALASHAYGGGVHPNAAGHAYLAPQILQAVLKYLRP